MKRIVLFLVTNLAVMVVLSIVTNLLGLNQALAANGLNLGALLVFSAVIGFGGAFISLLMSKTMAKWSTGAQRRRRARGKRKRGLAARDGQAARRQGRDRDARGGDLRGRAQRLRHRRVQELGAGRRLDRIAQCHVARGNRGRAGPRNRARGQRRHGDPVADPGRGQHLRHFPRPHRRQPSSTRPCSAPSAASAPATSSPCSSAQIVFGVLASIIVAWFSRQREFRADAGSAKYLGTAQPMMRALARLGGLPRRGAAESHFPASASPTSPDSWRCSRPIRRSKSAFARCRRRADHGAR